MFFLANSSLDLALFEYFHQTKLIYQNILIIWLKFQIQQELWFIDVHLFTFNCNILMANVLFSPLISIETNHNWMLHVNFSHCAKCLLQLFRHSFVAYSFCMHVRLVLCHVNAQNAKILFCCRATHLWLYEKECHTGNRPFSNTSKINKL